ncbi:SURF1-like protein [Gemmobacter aquaticus]|uniref:SURF1-like protein n=1 Tax=Gemmobacter aquaticus TaxID=490185 RepID=A0A918DBQ7_9RHOB|nr:SURF1 family protein [Gemmobacter aquaticus]GGO27624.1 SURF1-like protein [Gemmobacter aquaticus]
MSRRIILPLLFGLVGAAILIGLGTWQVQRLQWKEGLIATAEAKIAMPAVALPAQPDPVADRYLSVTVQGRFLGPEAHVLTSIQGQGPGFLVIAAYQTDDGRRILVDRGFVPETAKTAPRPPREVAVTGNLNWPDDVNSATPPPDKGRGIWFGRDVAAMASALGTEPLMLIARSDTGDGVQAQPVSATFRNDHLGYAITWFSLAVVWLGMTVSYLWRIRRRNV